VKVLVFDNLVHLSRLLFFVLFHYLLTYSSLSLLAVVTLMTPFGHIDDSFRARLSALNVRTIEGGEYPNEQIDFASHLAENAAGGDDAFVRSVAAADDAADADTADTDADISDGGRGSGVAIDRRGAYSAVFLYFWMWHSYSAP
jgi:hypothetical protein